MLFNSIDFLIFFSIFYILYWFVFNKTVKKRNIFLLVSSYIFYGWWNWKFLFLIFLSSIVDFYIGQGIYRNGNHSKKKLLLGLSLFVNLGILATFKYFNFFLESFESAFTILGFSFQLERIKLVLPVGISFYTFQTLSYSIDIYRNKLKPTNDIICFFAFVSFFPQLVAGPIERASNLIPQFKETYSFNRQDTIDGAKIVLLGFFKKIVIADRLAIFVNEVYGHISTYNSISIVIATIFFSFQIYCDFSGYSDIAIGISKAMGFKLMTNFKSPYFSRSVSEFWSRWHISLSSWFKDYVYIPLGGNRCSFKKNLLNIIVVFLLSGLWHGANWTFIFWGAFHGISLVFERVLEKLYFRRNVIRTISSQLINILITFFIVNIGWIFFRSGNLTDALHIMHKIIFWSDSGLSILTVDKNQL